MVIVVETIDYWAVHPPIARKSQLKPACEAGQEVLISYVPVTDVLAARAEQLDSKAFECDCARCQDLIVSILD